MHSDDFRKLLGECGERAAADFLVRKNYEIIDRNWRMSFGELDIVATFKSELVFVEVKSRLAARDAERYLFETLTFRKQTKLRQLTQIYLDRKYGWKPRPSYRIDVIGVIIKRVSQQKIQLNPIRIQHLINAV